MYFSFALKSSSRSESCERAILLAKTRKSASSSLLGSCALFDEEGDDEELGCLSGSLPVRKLALSQAGELLMATNWAVCVLCS